MEGEIIPLLQRHHNAFHPVMLSSTHQCPPGLFGEAGFSADGKGVVKQQTVFIFPAHIPVSRIIFASGNGTKFFVFHRIAHQYRHIIGCRYIAAILLIQTAGIGKRRIAHADFCRLSIHQLNKGFLRAGNMLCDFHRCIVSASQHQSIQQIPHGYLLSLLQIDTASIGLIDFIINCKGFIQLPMLNRDHSGHDFGNRCHTLLFILVFFFYNRIVRTTQHHIALRMDTHQLQQQTQQDTKTSFHSHHLRKYMCARKKRERLFLCVLLFLYTCITDSTRFLISLTLVRFPHL